MKSSALIKAGIDRLHKAMVSRVGNGGLPGIVTLLAEGDDVYTDVVGTMAFGDDQPMHPVPGQPSPSLPSQPGRSANRVQCGDPRYVPTFASSLRTS